MHTRTNTPTHHTYIYVYMYTHSQRTYRKAWLVLFLVPVADRTGATIVCAQILSVVAFSLGTEMIQIAIRRCGLL